jgi:tripartite-type tricarboxylate transporter receptor subunit TctC
VRAGLDLSPADEQRHAQCRLGRFCWRSTEAVARSTPDGYTLLFTAAPFAIAPAVFKSLGFDPVKDFTPIAQVASVPLLVVARADSPLKSIADLVAAAKKDGNAISYATFGNGSPPHPSASA